MSIWGVLKFSGDLVIMADYFELIQNLICFKVFKYRDVDKKEDCYYKAGRSNPCEYIPCSRNRKNL